MSKKLKNKSAWAGKKVPTVVGPEFGSVTRFWMAVSLVLVSFLLYKNTLHAPFVLDDVHKIQNNIDLRIEQLSQVFSKLVYPYSQNKSFVRNDPSRPVTFLTFTLNYYFGKLDPFGYRFVNLLGHGFVGVLLFLLTRRLFFLLFGYENVALSFVMALLFVVHPVNAIVALYPFNRSDILAALTSLGALLLFLSASPHPRWKHWAALGLFMLGLGSKQSVAVLPAILLMMDFVIVHRCDWAAFRTRIRAHIPFWIVLAVYLLARVAYFGSIGDLEAESAMPRETYFLNQIYSFMRYIQFMLFPTGLSLDHMPPQFSSLAEPKLLWSAVGLFALAGIAWSVIRKGTEVSRLVLFSTLWWVIQLAPTSSVFPTTTPLAENRLYVAEYGVLLLMLLAYCAVFRVDLKTRSNPGARKMCLGLMGFHLVFLGWMAYNRGLLFSDPFKLWEDVLRVYPKQPRAHYSLGVLYYEKKDADKALNYYQKTVDIDPTYAMAYNNMGMIYGQRWEMEKSVEYFKKSIAAVPREKSYCNLGRAYMNLKKYRESLEALDGALRINPSSCLANTLSGRVWYEQKDLSKAMENYQRASASCPDSPELLNNLALVSMEKQKFDEALDYLNRAVTIDPMMAEANYNLSVVYNKMGRSDLSQGFYDKACSLDPQYIFRPVHAGAMGEGFQIPPNIEKYFYPSTPRSGN